MSTETVSAGPPVTIDDLLTIDDLPAERQRWAAAAIFTALAMASLDTAIANIALPAIAAVLHANPADVIWVVNVSRLPWSQRFCRLPPLARSSATAGSISEACYSSRWRRFSPIASPQSGAAGESTG
jgi:hypothetical protein